MEEIPRDWREYVRAFNVIRSDGGGGGDGGDGGDGTSAKNNQILNKLNGRHELPAPCKPGTKQNARIKTNKRLTRMSFKSHEKDNDDQDDDCVDDDGNGNSDGDDDVDR